MAAVGGGANAFPLWEEGCRRRASSPAVDGGDMPGYEALCDFGNLYQAYKAVRKGKRGKKEVIEFEMNLAKNLCQIQRQLENKTWRQQPYFHFWIYEPKARSIYTPRYADRVVQHCLCDFILAPALELRLIYDNAACRIGKGTDVFLDRLCEFLRAHYRKHGTEDYFLKCDIQNISTASTMRC
jgi:hypothetical protein